jgi:CubicO group peptidase (beta-lactamase class C family)
MPFRNFSLWIVLLVAGGTVLAGQADWVFPGKKWETKSPAEVGLDPVKLEKFAKAVGAGDPNRNSCGCIIRNGYLVYSWGNQDEQLNWASSSKPVFSTLLFFAIDSGKLKGVHDRVGDWGWKFSDKDKPITFYHLANNISGYACQEPPGEAFNYNDAAIQLYYLTLEKVFGKDINSAAMECFQPLQIEGKDLFSEKGRLVATPRDFARICWLWVNRGNWNGRQLLPREYFDKYMKPQVPVSLPLSVTTKADDYLEIGSYGGKPKPFDYGPGKYGFNWWFNGPQKGDKKDRPFLPGVPVDTIMTFGSRGCNSVMMPSLGLVVTGRVRWGGLGGAPRLPRSAETAPSSQRGISGRGGGGGASRLNENLKLLVDSVLPSDDSHP